MEERILALLEQQLAELKEIRARLDRLEERVTGGLASASMPAMPGDLKETPLPRPAKIFDTVRGRLGARRGTETPAVPSTRAPSPPPRPKVPDLRLLKEAIISTLFEAGEPMTFEKVYQILQTNRVDLPSDRPKLIVRKLLYDQKLFRMVRGTFSLADGIVPGAVLPADAPENIPEGALMGGGDDDNSNVAMLGPDGTAVGTYTPESGPPEPQPTVMMEPPAVTEAAPVAEPPGSVAEETPAETKAPAAEPMPVPPASEKPAAKPAAPQPAPMAPRVRSSSAIPPGGYAKALEAILGPDGTLKVKNE